MNMVVDFPLAGVAGQSLGCRCYGQNQHFAVNVEFIFIARARTDLPKPLTTKHIAQRLAAHQAGSEAYYARQVRNFTQGRLLEPIGRRGIGRTAAAEFAEHHVFEAQILSVLTEIGLTPTLLEGAMRVLRRSSILGHLPEDLPPSLKGGLSSSIVKDAIQGVQVGEQWDVQLRIFRRQDGQHYVVGSAIFAADQLVSDPLVAAVQGAMHIGTIVLSLNTVFAPLQDG